MSSGTKVNFDIYLGGRTEVSVPAGVNNFTIPHPEMERLVVKWLSTLLPEQREGFLRALDAEFGTTSAATFSTFSTDPSKN